jgi:hypothetical protein
VGRAMSRASSQLIMGRVWSLPMQVPGWRWSAH